jgi:hypothetical protein
MTSEKVRENRLRRMAARQGFALSKSRRRDPRAYDFGTWQLSPTLPATRPRGRHVFHDLDELEAFLIEPEDEATLGTRLVVEHDTEERS